MLFMPPFESVSWSNVFHTSQEVRVKFITFLDWSELGEGREIVEDVHGVSLMARLCPGDT